MFSTLFRLLIAVSPVNKIFWLQSIHTLSEFSLFSFSQVDVKVCPLIVAVSLWPTRTRSLSIRGDKIWRSREENQGDSDDYRRPSIKHKHTLPGHRLFLRQTERTPPGRRRFSTAGPSTTGLCARASLTRQHLVRFTQPTLGVATCQAEHCKSVWMNKKRWLSVVPMS